MRNTDHLTRKQLRELMRKPVSPSIAERRRKADEDARWLLAYNLREMESDAIHISESDLTDGIGADDSMSEPVLPSAVDKGNGDLSQAFVVLENDEPSYTSSLTKEALSFCSQAVLDGKDERILMPKSLKGKDPALPGWGYKEEYLVRIFPPVKGKKEDDPEKITVQVIVEPEGERDEISGLNVMLMLGDEKIISQNQITPGQSEVEFEIDTSLLETGNLKITFNAD